MAVAMAALRSTGSRRTNSFRRVSDGMLPVEDTECVKGLISKASIDRIVLKLDSNAVWQQRRLIVTEDRIYMLLSRTDQLKFEVADSILMEDIVGVVRMNERPSSTSSSAPPFAVSTATNALKSAAANAALEFEKPPSAFTDVSRESIQVPPGISAAAISNWQRVLNGSDVQSGFEIHTSTDGMNSGKYYYFSTGSEQTVEELAAHILDASIKARKAFQRKHKIELAQFKIRKIHQSDVFQCLVALAIGANFIVTILQDQLMLNDPHVQSIFDSIDVAFTILFVAELFMNFAANAVWPFCLDGWNWFDVIVVLTSFVFLFISSSNNLVVKQMRIFRAFRVIRAFGRFGQFRKIVGSILASILPGAQALLIGLVVVFVYATIGVQYWGQQDPDDFGDFFHAFYTLFSIVAFARWPEGAISPFNEDGTVDYGVMIYLYSYVVIVMFVLLQVVVAVILDNFYKASELAHQEDALKAAQEAGRSSTQGHALDPVLERICQRFDTNQDLDQRVAQLFHAFDTDGTGSLSHAEVSDGLFRLDPARPTRLSLEEFHRITEEGALCGGDGELSLAQFKTVMLREAKKFTQRRAADAMHGVEAHPYQSAVLSALRMTLVEQGQVQAALAAHEGRIGRVAELQELVRREQACGFDQILRLLQPPCGGAGVFSPQRSAAGAASSGCEATARQC